jgi:hypothetical protein
MDNDVGVASMPALVADDTSEKPEARKTLVQQSQTTTDNTSEKPKGRKTLVEQTKTTPDNSAEKPKGRKTLVQQSKTTTDSTSEKPKRRKKLITKSQNTNNEMKASIQKITKAKEKKINDHENERKRHADNLVSKPSCLHLLGVTPLGQATDTSPDYQGESNMKKTKVEYVDPTVAEEESAERWKTLISQGLAVTNQKMVKRRLERYLDNPNFYLGLSKDADLGPLDRIGYVHDVVGDGNCGYDCLLLVISTFKLEKRDCKPKIATQLGMRKALVRWAKATKAQFLEESPLMKLFVTQEQKETELEAITEAIHTQGTKYLSRSFMMEEDENGGYINDCHWINLLQVLPIFCCHYKMRAIVYMLSNQEGRSAVWQTYAVDGREGSFSLMDQHRPGVVRYVDVDLQTFGILYDQTHLQYIDLLRNDELVALGLLHD